MTVTWDIRQKAMKDWVVRASGLPEAKVVWMQQDARRPEHPVIFLRISNIAEIGTTEVHIEDNPHTFDPITVTSVDVSGNRVVAAAHGRQTGDGPVVVSSSTDDLPEPLADEGVWLVALDANHLRFCATYEDTGGGHADNPITPIVLTDAGSGVLTIEPTPDTLRTGEEVLAVARTYLRVSLELRAHSAPDGPNEGENIATSILQRVRARRELPSQQDILAAANMALIEVERVRAILGVRDTVLFEPRSYLNVYFCIPAEESEALSIIESVRALNQTTGHTVDFRVNG